MKRTHLRVTPGEGPVIPGDIPETVASLSKLTRSTSASLIQRLNPFHRQPPLRFEFVALCAGEDEPVEFYYGADDHLDALEQRLRSIYPPTYEMEHVEIDLTKRLVRPVELTREEFAERIENNQLFHEMEQSVDGRAAVSDGGEVAVASDSTDADTELPERSGSQQEDDTVLDDIDLAAPRTVDDDEPLNALEGPTETADGTILARPPLSEVEPYGVEWWGAAARRKDWMTTLTEFTDTRGKGGGLAGEGSGQARLPLTPLVKQLAEANQPLAFQVVFQRRSDWSRDARRRAGELLDGTDTLLQKFLSLESPGARRRPSNRRNPHGATRRPSSSSTRRRTHSSTGEGPSRPTNVEEASRFDQVRQNSPKRTFSVNLQLLTLMVDDDEPEDLGAILDPLRSVFDLVDGQFYEIDGRRLRSKGYLPGSGRRHARAVLDRFMSRSVATDGRRVAITNRSETRPDLVLNGNELANFLVIPQATDIPTPTKESTDVPATTTVETPGPLEETPEPKADERHDSVREVGVSPFSSAPESVLHRDDEVNRLTGVLAPLASGEQIDPILLTGPPGSGKTCTAKHTVDRLCQEHPGVNAVYINCWEEHSPFQMLYRILDDLGGATDLHRQSTATDIVLERLRNYDDQHCVLVLDEVDQLDDEGILYDLLNLPRFSLLLIVNREADLFDGLDDRLASRLGGCEHIRLDRYSADQLADILTAQADVEEVPWDIERSECERIAEAVNGDARVAITTLRIAARRANEVAADRISQDIVERALPEARQELRRRHIDGLPPHHQTIFRVIEEHDRIAPRDLFKEYRNRVEEPKSNRTVRKYLKQLERDDLVTAEGTTRDRRYRCPENRQPD